MNDLRIDFKHPVLRLPNYEVLHPSEKPPNSSEGPSQPLQVTDFSINRILSENNGKTCKLLNKKHQVPHNVLPSALKTTSYLPRLSRPSAQHQRPQPPPGIDILDLSKTSAECNKCETFPYKTTSYHQTTHADFLAAAAVNATKLYAHFFPQMFSSYVTPGLNLVTPPASPYPKRYFAPYIINSPNIPTSRFPASTISLSPQSETPCSHSSCFDCRGDYFKPLPYKSTPVQSYPASLVSSTSTSNFESKSLPTVLLNSHSLTIPLTSVTNFSPSTKGSSITNSNISAFASEEVSYKCRICEKVFGCSQTLQGHERTHKSPRYECTDCGKGFSQLRNYKYHLSVHRGTKEFAAECPECGKTFNDKGYLSSHMKIHRNRKEYECPYCPKSFNQRVAFNMHVRIHTGVKPHKCNECGKRFSRKMLLKQHMRTHSGEKPYQCSVCGKSFADRSNMTLHHRLHSGIKPFNCPICPKAFTKKHHLKTHLNYHTGCKPYVCPHSNCSQAFTQSSNMRTHAKKCQYKPLQLSFPAVASSNGATKTAAPSNYMLATSSLSRLPASLSATSTVNIPSLPAGIRMSSLPPAQQPLLSTLQKI